MPYTTYILHSPSLNKYYTGFTAGKVQQRLARHLSDHKGYTARAKDWIIVWTKSFDDDSEALLLEKYIKKRGASRFLKDQEIR